MNVLKNRVNWACIGAGLILLVLIVLRSYETSHTVNQLRVGLTELADKMDKQQAFLEAFETQAGMLQHHAESLAGKLNEFKHLSGVYKATIDDIQLDNDVLRGLINDINLTNRKMQNQFMTLKQDVEKVKDVQPVIIESVKWQDEDNG